MKNARDIKRQQHNACLQQVVQALAFVEELGYSCRVYNFLVEGIQNLSRI